MNRYIYEASFNNERKLYTAVYIRSNGSIVSIEEEILINDITSSMIDTLKSLRIHIDAIVKIKNFGIDDIEYYDIEGTTKNKKYQLYMESDGTVLEISEERKNNLLKFIIVGTIVILFFTI